MSRVRARHLITLGAVVVAAGFAAPSGLLARRATFLPYSQAKPVLDALADVLPSDLRREDEPSREAAWNRWIVAHDKNIRARLAQGDADTIVNWLLFGTTFTSRPRFEPDAASGGDVPALIEARAADLVQALRAPGQDERRLFARQFLEARGYRLDTAAQRTRLMQHFVAETARVFADWRRYAAELDQARASGGPTQDFAARSKVFRDRGLSLDTSLQPSFALERALTDLARRGLLPPRSIKRVGVIGPGLDFSDKSSGFDVYPEQTVQPFALIDTLSRLDLAAPEPAHLEVVTFDISPRVNTHLARARTRVSAGGAYTLRFLLDPSIPWRAEFLDYWQSAGTQIGGAAAPPAVALPSRPLRTRAVRLRKDVVLRVVPFDLNIVTQQPDEAGFDLLVATNVLVYYDTLDQSLAVANIEHMLNPGGFLLSNNALLELPSARLHSAGYTTVVYSALRDDGDHVVWYRRDQ